MLMNTYSNFVPRHLFKMIMVMLTIKNSYYHIFCSIIFNESNLEIAPLFLINLGT